LISFAVSALFCAQYYAIFVFIISEKAVIPAALLLQFIANCTMTMMIRKTQRISTPTPDSTHITHGLSKLLAVLPLYTVSQKNIPDIFDCNFKTNYQISIIFATNIPGTTCCQITVQFTTSPNVCFCTTEGNQIKQNMCWNKQKTWKNIPDIIDRNL